MVTWQVGQGKHAKLPQNTGQSETVVSQLKKEIILLKPK